MKSSVVSGENRGSVKEILLKALQSGDKYGYEINKEIETKSGGKFFLKEASLYSGLKRLQASGYISSYWKDGELGIRRHYYSITQKGLEKLNASNFTWDSSKNFLDEMFKNEKIANLQNNNTQRNNQIEKATDLSEEDLNTADKINIEANKENDATNFNLIQKNQKDQENKEIKKNPFQIEVSPFQQSFFDTNSSETVDDLQNATENTNVSDLNESGEDDKNSETNSLFDTVNNTETNTNFNPDKTNETNKIAFNETNVDNIVKTDNDATSNKNIPEQIDFSKQAINETDNSNSANFNSTENLSYDKLIKNYEDNDYSTSLQKENVIDIASLFNRNNEINESNIIFDNMQKNDNTTLTNQNDVNNNKNFKTFEKVTENNNESLHTDDDIVASISNSTADHTISINNNSQSDEIINENFENPKNEQNTLDFKNIFGSLLVDNKETDNENINQTSNDDLSLDTSIINNPQEDIKQPKTELPRINVDNDVNVMLKSEKKHYSENDYTANSAPDRSYEDKIVKNNKYVSGSIGVKQYINNVHKQTLISRATNITEEVNLEGINIREYSKMNNKLIKNSNYIYSNKLNFVLAILISCLIVIESIISFVVLSKSNLLQPFEIVFFSLTILVALTTSIVYGYKYFKDKFKVDTKHYNFKSQMFYFALIFIVCFVLILCINIFAGMNINNTSDFVTKIIFETVILLNFVLFPALKLLLHKFRYFSN